MRLHPKLPRPALALALAVALVAPAAARAQVTTSAPAPKAPAGPPIPLAHFVPGGDLVAYFECDGLDAHADAWRKTALYQVLNTTTTGPMLEDLASQIIDQTYTKLGTRWASGKEIVNLIEHAARNGFVFAAGGKGGDPKSGFGVLVLRGVYKSKEMRPFVGRMLGALYDPKAKPKAVDVGGHKIVVAKSKAGKSFGFWIEDSRKEDLVLIPGAPDEAAVVSAATNVLAALDGSKPDAQSDPTRQALAKEEEGFVPTAFGFVNALALPPGILPQGMQDVKGMDFRWGMVERETMSILRISAPKPREGSLAILDQPTFDKTSLPPIPEGVEGFSVLSMDLGKTYDRLAAVAQAVRPDAAAQLENMAQQFQEKTKLRLKEDLLAHLGPRFAVYNAPSKGSDAPKPAPGPLAALLGGREIPRLTIVAEVDDTKAFGRTLDALMIAVNQGLRGLSPMLAAVMPADEKNDNIAPGGPGGSGGEPKKKSSRDSATLEFKQVGPGVYTMAPPPALTAILPSYVRPTIRLGAKHVVFSVSPEAAKAALEVKGGGAPGATYANTLQAAPAGLVFLRVDDSAREIAEGLATLPMHLQAMADRAAQGPAALGAPATPENAGPGSAGRPNGPMPMRAPGGPGGSSMPGGPGMPGGSGGPGMPGAEGGASEPSSKSLFTLRIDPASLPSADAIKPMLAPGLIAVSADDDGVEVLVRESFLHLPGLSENSIASTMIRPALTKLTERARAASEKAAAAAAPAAPAGGPPGGPVPGPPGVPGARPPR